MRPEMHLSARLEAVSSMISPGKRLADVGTDHGFVPIKLVLDEVIPSAIAMDIATGPLQRAAEHIKEYGLGNRIETRHSDGLDRLKDDEADSILIAGMGGELIVSILRNGHNLFHVGTELILSPHTHPELVRKYLFENGFNIIDEKIVLEDNKYYFIIKCVYDGVIRNGTEEEYRFGPILIKKKDSVLRLYLQKERNKFNEIVRFLDMIDRTEEMIK